MKRILSLFSLIIVSLIFVGASCVSFGGSSSPSTSGPAGIFLSTDKGESWKRITKYPTNEGVKDVSSASVYRMIQDPQDPKALYWGTRKSGMLYSYNDGSSWQRTGSFLDKGFIYSIVVHPKEKCTIYATNGRFVYKSEDCSRSWQEVYREGSASSQISTLAISYFEPHQIFMGTNKGKLFQSSDEGKSWHIIQNFGSGLKQIILHPLQSDVMFAAKTEKGLYRSVNGGAVWENLSSNLKKYSGALNFRRFKLHPYKLNNLYWISDYGILISEDSGDSWRAMKLLTSPGSVKIYGFAVNPQDDNELYYTATAGNRSILYRSLDSGQTWTTKKLPSSQIPTMLRVHPENTNWLYAGFTIPPKK